MKYDVINRQTAIDALCDNCETVDSSCSHYPCKRYLAIEKLPSAQPEQRWIPVSERLPEGGHNIIFCDTKGNVCEGVYHAIPGQWVGFRWNAIYHHDDVMAWKPLPDPYKEE